MTQQNIYCVTVQKGKNQWQVTLKLNIFTKKIPLLSKLQTKYCTHLNKKEQSNYVLMVVKAFFIGNFKLDK